jgi:large conductance mechanosensitive channel
MKALQEFKAFAMKGNVIDMAVGVVIGAGFGKIVSSLVADIITPVLGLLIGGVDFTNLKVTLKEATAPDGKNAVTWNYGTFIQTVFDFLIIAWAIFVLIKLLGKLERKKPPAEPPPPPPPSAEIVLLTEIRDALRAKS